MSAFAPLFGGHQVPHSAALETWGLLIRVGARASWTSARSLHSLARKSAGSTLLRRRLKQWRLLAHSCPGRVRRHVRSWRKPTPHSKAHPLVNRL